MKKTFSILIIVLFLHACAPQNVSTVEPILTPSPTEKPFTPTPENTSTPEPITISYDLDERGIYKEVLNEELIPGLTYSVTIVTDISLRTLREGAITKVYPNPYFTNAQRNNESASKSISFAIAYTTFKNWQNDDTSHANTTFEEYLDLLLEAQQTGNHSTVVFTLKANDMNTIKYDSREITDVDPFEVTVVFMDPIGTVAVQNMQRLKDIRGKEVQSLGTGVLEVIDMTGNITKKLFIFVETPTLGQRDRAMSRATASLIDALTRTFTPENETSWSSDSSGGNPFGQIIDDSEIRKMLLSQVQQGIAGAIAFDPIQGK
ncbi:MAG TPA: hypothetical protein DHW49_10345 [Anaerolineae bacterium]|nr:hypothetical protein [Anaerolineae bacterium]